MRTLGFLITAAGILLLLISCNMDVSVATTSGMRVNNIGLMHEQSMLVLTGIGLIIAGAVLWAATRKRTREAEVPVAVDDTGYTPAEMRDLDALLADSGWTGIALLSSDPRVIHSISPGSAAEEAGVLPGDRLVKVDGRYTSDDLRENIMLLAGDVDTAAAIVLRRGDRALEFEVERR